MMPTMSASQQSRQTRSYERRSAFRSHEEEGERAFSPNYLLTSWTRNAISLHERSYSYPIRHEINDALMRRPVSTGCETMAMQPENDECQAVLLPTLYNAGVVRSAVQMGSHGMPSLICRGREAKPSPTEGTSVWGECLCKSIIQLTLIYSSDMLFGSCFCSRQLAPVFHCIKPI